MAHKQQSHSSRRWLQEHFSDKYVKQAHEKGMRSRAWFKLDEIQKSDQLLKSGMTVMDLGSMPGSWSQYTVTKIGKKGRIISCDIVQMDPVIGVDFIQGDFCDELVRKSILEHIGIRKVQVVLSDMSPNISGNPAIDLPKSIYLAELALEMCRDALAPGGSFLVKAFYGDGFDECLKNISSLFKKTKIRKPNASRARSREVYIVATGRKL